MTSVQQCVTENSAEITIHSSGSVNIYECLDRDIVVVRPIYLSTWFSKYPPDGDYEKHIHIVRPLPFKPWPGVNIDFREKCSHSAHLHSYKVSENSAASNACKTATGESAFSYKNVISQKFHLKKY